MVYPGKLPGVFSTVDAVKKLSSSTNGTELRLFFGLCNVYLRLVPDFARTASPYNRMLREEKQTKIVTLKDDGLEAVDRLTKKPKNLSMSAWPRSDLPHTLETYACYVQIK